MELKQKLSAGPPGILLDVRSPAEFSSIKITGAMLEPLDALDPARIARALPDTKTPVYVVCRSGGRAKQAIGKLEAAGVTECVLVEGGMMAWQEAGLPVERGESRIISLERQVRIAAGAMVFIGTLLGVFWSRLFLVLPAFVGGGLVFAGATDRCGMALLLTRMPWNRVGAPKACGCAVSSN